MSDAAIVELDGDTVTYRASAVGGCDLALLAARLGYDAIPVRADAPIMATFAAGHRIENEVLMRMDSVRHRQCRVELPLTGRIRIVGHIDGFDYDDNSIVEVKSQNVEEWDRFGREGWRAGFFPKYQWQMSCYMHGFAEQEPTDELYPLKLIRCLRDDQGRWTGEMATSYVDKPFYSVAQLRERVLKVEAAAATGVLNATCTPSYPCPYFYLHEELDRELIDDDGVDALAREYEAAVAGVRTAEGKRDNCRRALRAAVETDKYQTSSGVKVTFYTARNPPRLDKDLLAGFLEKHDRRLDQFQLTSTSERLRVTLPDEPPPA